MKKSIKREILEHLVEQPEEAERKLEGKPLEAESKKPSQTTEEKQAGARNQAVMRYMALLFGIAFVVVLLSFIVSRKDSRETIHQLNQNANSALSHAEQLQDENRSLTEKNSTLTASLTEAEETQKKAEEALEKSNTALTKAQEENKALIQQVDEEKKTAENQKKAYELLIAAETALAEGEREKFSAIMGELAPLSTYLGDSGKAVHEKLLKQ